MEPISVNVCGDNWLDQREFRDELDRRRHDSMIEISLNAEGPSLEYLGIHQKLQEFCLRYQKSLESIKIAQWSNNVEKLGYCVGPHLVSHFFWLSDRYNTPTQDHSWEYLFGCFVGRRTLARMMMLWSFTTQMPGRCLLSLMRDVNISQDWILEPWNPLPASFHAWSHNPGIHSIDGHSIRDQYTPGVNTHQDLLSHYHRFLIEIAMESYTRGNCFFPTEKTIRPIKAGKPMLIYGPKSFLARLRDLGFRTWNDIWDESYDQYEGPERWNLIWQQICAIEKWSGSRLRSMLEVNNEISSHNRRVLEHIIETYRPHGFH